MIMHIKVVRMRAYLWPLVFGCAFVLLAQLTPIEGAKKMRKRTDATSTTNSPTKSLESLKISSTTTEIPSAELGVTGRLQKKNTGKNKKSKKDFFDDDDGGTNKSKVIDNGNGKGGANDKDNNDTEVGCGVYDDKAGVFPFIVHITDEPSNDEDDLGDVGDWFKVIGDVFGAGGGGDDDDDDGGSDDFADWIDIFKDFWDGGAEEGGGLGIGLITKWWNAWAGRSALHNNRDIIDNNSSGDDEGDYDVDGDLEGDRDGNREGNGEADRDRNRDNDDNDDDDDDDEPDYTCLGVLISKEHVMITKSCMDELDDEGGSEFPSKPAAGFVEFAKSRQKSYNNVIIRLKNKFTFNMDEGSKAGWLNRICLEKGDIAPSQSLHVLQGHKIYDAMSVKATECPPGVDSASMFCVKNDFPGDERMDFVEGAVLVASKDDKTKRLVGLYSENNEDLQEQHGDTIRIFQKFDPSMQP